MNRQDTINFEEKLDRIDAEIFTGDTLYNAESFEKLEWYIGRWNRALKDHKDMEMSASPDELCLKYGDNGHPQFDHEKWRAEVLRAHTFLSYWDWVAAQIEEAAHDAITDASPALYIKVEGGVIQAMAIRNIDLGDKQLDIIIDDLDNAEEDGRPDLIAFNGGEVPKDFVFIF